MMADETKGEAPWLEKFLARLAAGDPDVHGAIKNELSKSTSGIKAEAASFGPRTASMRQPPLRAETIVMKGRPALFVRNNKIDGTSPLNDPISKLMIERLAASADMVEPWLPLIGRIDCVNHAAGYPYLGTGWLIADGVVCTNRHVAELLGRQDGASYVFSRGLFGKAIEVSLNRRREIEFPGTPADSFRITEILWIEPADGPDLALLRVDMPTDGTRPRFLPLADADAAEQDDIATIGYPARAYDDAIPDQQWMDQIYGGIYDVKRAAPGRFWGVEEGNATYDCTTLGGASGSPVISLKSGKVIALHFAGLYKVENYGVPASVLRKYAQGVPKVSAPASENPDNQPGAPPPLKPPVPPPLTEVAQIDLPPGGFDGSVTVTLPLTLSISLGLPVLGAPAAAVPLSLASAAAQLAARGIDGVLVVRPGFDGRGDCIVLAAEPARIDTVRQAAPTAWAGYPVEVRFATIDEQLGITETRSEAPGAIVYDDAARTAVEFSFAEVTDEPMAIIAHVGPEESFPVLKDFIAGAKGTLTSSMYQFFASHVADVVDAKLAGGKVTIKLVADPATRDASGAAKPGEFYRSDKFAAWRQGGRFRNLYVRKGNGGFVDSAYHIKVTVRDHDSIWLSSGNWTRSSQPFPDPATGAAKGNREWHIVAKSKRLAKMFEAHINADFAWCENNGAVSEAPLVQEQIVDVPIAALDEAPPRKLAPLRIEPPRIVKVKPILTPDKRGKIYTDAVLALIRSAKEQLVFQNQYIRIRKGMTGNLSELVDALVERSKSIPDVRIILRSGDIDEDVAELRRRGMDVMRCARVIANTHTKGIVVDAQRVLIGSQNWSSQAVASNRDASLLFDDDQIARYFLEAFEIDWARARPAAGRTETRPVLVARGEQPPAGYMRMTLSEYRNG